MLLLTAYKGERISREKEVEEKERRGAREGKKEIHESRENMCDKRIGKETRRG